MTRFEAQPEFADFSLADKLAHSPFEDPDDLAHWREGCRLAGLR